jgi:hypothetical protein
MQLVADPADRMALGVALGSDRAMPRQVALGNARREGRAWTHCTLCESVLNTRALSPSASPSVSPPPLVCWFPLAAERGAISPIQLRDERRRRGTPVAGRGAPRLAQRQARGRVRAGSLKDLRDRRSVSPRRRSITRHDLTSVICLALLHPQARHCQARGPLACHSAMTIHEIPGWPPGFYFQARTAIGVPSLNVVFFGLHVPPGVPPTRYSSHRMASKSAAPNAQPGRCRSTAGPWLRLIGIGGRRSR